VVSGLLVRHDLRLAAALVGVPVASYVCISPVVIGDQRLWFRLALLALLLLSVVAWYVRWGQDLAALATAAVAVIGSSVSRGRRFDESAPGDGGHSVRH